MVDSGFECPEGWNMHRSVLYRKYKDPKPSTSFAIFDMDNTLMLTPSYYIDDLIKGVRTRVAKPVMANDFAVFSPSVRKKLLIQLNKGKSILVVSNQRDLLDNVHMAYLVLERIELLLKELDVPLYIFLATRHDIYRKPAPGILLFYEKHFNSGLKIDYNNSFYVGDAAGRRLNYKASSTILRKILDTLKRKDFSNHRYFNIQGEQVVYVDANYIISKTTISKMKNVFTRDFSDCDLKFAMNNGMKFYTADEFFYDLPSYELNISFDPKNVGSDPFLPTLKNGLVVLIGNVSSGKTYLSKKFPGFLSLSLSQFQSYVQYFGVLKSTLSKQKNVILDDTNHVSSKRIELVSLAHSLGVTVTYIHLDLSLSLINHLNKIRRMYLNENTAEYFEVIERIESFHNRSEMKLKVEKPSLDEGPDVIYTITDESFPMDHNKLTVLHLP